MVESEVPPDTSTITAVSDDVFIALADDAEPGVQLPEFVFGDGSAGLYVVDGGGRVEFENRELRGETIDYFFIRLHSSVVRSVLSSFSLVNAHSVRLQDVSTLNDSLARRPSIIIIVDSTSVVPTDDSTTQTAIIGSIVGVVVIVLIIAITVTVIAALVLKNRLRGNVSILER